MRILLLTDDLLPGGVPRHVLDLSRGLAGRGHAVTIAATDGPLAAEIGDGIEFLPLDIVQPHSLNKDYFGLLRTTRTLLSYLRRGHVDLIHTHKRYSDFLGRIVARLCELPHVSTCHNTFGDFRRLSPFGERTIACSESIRQILISKYRKSAGSVETVYCGVRPIPRLPATTLRIFRKLWGIEETRRVIVSLGSFFPYKDRPALVESIVLVQQEMRKARALCVVVGEGPQRSKVESMVLDRGIADIVRVSPAVRDIAPVVNMGEFFVLSSRQEGIPYAILEAASLRKPHVATAVGGIPEFIEPDVSGILVPPHSPSHLAEGIARFLSNPSDVRRMGRNAQRLYLRRHGFDRFIDQTLAVYRSTLNGSGERPEGRPTESRAHIKKRKPA